MSYQIVFTPHALAAFDSLPKKTQRIVGRHIDALADNPRPRGSKKLEGRDGLTRIRAGDYRVVYRIRDDKLEIVVILIGDRKDVYRVLERILAGRKRPGPTRKKARQSSRKTGKKSKKKRR